MSISVGENSWTTIAEADAYLTSRAGAEDWFDLEDEPASPGEDSKESFLVSAFYWLFDDPGFGLTAALTEDFVKRAQIETALFLLNYRADFENRQAKKASGVDSFSNSKWSEALGIVTKPQNVLDILSAGGYSNLNNMVQFYGDDYT